MLGTKLENEKKKILGSLEEVVVKFAWGSWSFIKEMASQLAFISYLLFLLSITSYCFHLSLSPLFTYLNFKKFITIPPKLF